MALPKPWYSQWRRWFSKNLGVSCLPPNDKLMFLQRDSCIIRAIGLAEALHAVAYARGGASRDLINPKAGLRIEVAEVSRLNDSALPDWPHRVLAGSRRRICGRRRSF